MTGRHPYQQTDLTAYLYVIKLHMGEGWGGGLKFYQQKVRRWLAFQSLSLCQMAGRYTTS